MLGKVLMYWIKELNAGFDVQFLKRLTQVRVVYFPSTSCIPYTVHFLNIRTPNKICCNHSKIWTMWLYHRVMSPNDADRMANSVDPDQTALLWVCTVSPDLSVWKLRNITVVSFLQQTLKFMPGPVAADGHGFNPWVWQHSFMEVDHGIISKAILSIMLIQVGQLSVTGERMCTKYWLRNRLGSLPRNSVVRITDCLDMTIGRNMKFINCIQCMLRHILVNYNCGHRNL